MKKSIGIVLYCLPFFLSAQIKHPKASPQASVHQRIGLTDITIQYSRPATRGRKIFEGVVPYGRIWRVGANESTKIEVQDTVTILGNVLPKGTYALYAFPEKDKWEIVFHKNITHWGDGRNQYNPQEDAFRIKIAPERKADFQENFQIAFDSITHTSAQMIWSWANTNIRIPIQVETDKIMQKEIRQQLKEHPTAQTYYEAARYLLEQQKEERKALDYVGNAIRIGGDTYYFYRVKSLLEARLGQYESAIRAAQISLELAHALGKDEFVRMNTENIVRWKEKLKSSNN